ncbi:MAG: hypothetical protein AB7S36_23965 [Planctomycetota bacterium]
MLDQPLLLMTGYAPFEVFARNPSFGGLLHAKERGLLDQLPGRVEIAELPVAFERAAGEFALLVAQHRPVAAVSFGVHRGGASRYRDGVFYVERTAKNQDGNAAKARADNEGIIRAGLPIVPGAPATLRASFPTDELVARLRAAGFAAEVSDDAGDYLCNHIFYAAMHSFGASHPYGFVHIPPTDDVGGTVTIDQMAEAQVVVATVMLEAVAAIGR